MTSSLAEKFKSKRTELGLSQKALAEGICEQSQISKIEKGNYMPAADLLYKLSVRLQVPLDYFFNEHFEAASNLNHFKTLIAKLLEDRNYKDLEYLYHLEKEKHTYLSRDDTAYLAWVDSLLLFYLYDQREKAIHQLEHSLSKLTNKESTYLRILNTLSNFYSLVGREQEYEDNYAILIKHYQEKDLNFQEYLFGYLRVRYNYAHYLLSKNKTLEAIREALETIEICKAKQTSYQLAPLLIIVGNASLGFLEKERIKDYYMEARDLCKIFDNQLMLLQIESGLKELEDDASI